MMLWSSLRGQFIDPRGGGAEFERTVRATGDEEEPWARWIRVQWRGSCSGDQRGAAKAYGDAVESESHAADNSDDTTAVKSLPQAVSKGRSTAAGRGGVQPTGGRDFYRAMFIRWPRRTNHGERQSTATGHRWRAGGVNRDLFQFGYCTMASSFQTLWQIILKRSFLSILNNNLTQALHQCCNATYQLQLCYSNPR
jgi:hypothetical protein